jgi:lipoprotein-anchoring transpeptidase ErfK/SrfK
MPKETNHAEHKKSEEKVAENKQLTFDEPTHNTHAKPQDAYHPDSPETNQSDDIVESNTVDEVAADLQLESTDVPEEAKPAKSVKADTHSRSKKVNKQPLSITSQKKWQKVLGLSLGVFAIIALVVSATASQYYKNKVMPGVQVAHIESGAKTADELTAKLESQQKALALHFVSGEKKFQPKQEEIGLQIDVKKTVSEALQAKRGQGILPRLKFWEHVTIPVKYSINDTLLSQYIETNLPELAKAPQDAQLQFDAKQSKFVITPQADGEGANMQRLKQELDAAVSSLSTSSIKVEIAKKGPGITEKKLQPLVEPANALVVRKVVLSGLGYTFQARPADIASWITPTPQDNGSIELVVDSAKVQSYVDSVSKRISNAPVDRKVVKDQQTGAEVVLQEGRAGTELADKQTLATAITSSLKEGRDVSQAMNITTAAFQTVNMEAYEKWIEVDLSEQRTTAYERATPVKNFIIASGTKGHETVIGEFSIWLKVRSQTMQGGSKADGSYYSIPNVEWVSYFYKDYALHGAWWREKFGYPASHGCVNMTNADAKWVFDWAPVGTKVIVHQ